jgi:redox-sensitive bicupin YhaK (pirin superfamily)
MDSLGFRSLARVVRGHATSDGAGVRLTRVIGTHELDHLDPFLLLDEFKSDSSADYSAGFPDHPHRGFETVTYMLAGKMEHRDQLGHRGVLESGSVQWMTAGRGIIHSEMPRQERGLMWGFQLWVNLPADEKLCEPLYRDIPKDAIPEVALADAMGVVRVIAGDFRGTAGAITGLTIQPLYLDVTLARHSDEELAVPEGHNACVYVFDGAARFGDSSKLLGRHDLGVLGPGARLRVQANGQGVRFLLLGGRPLNEPIARYGPFVMNTREQLQRAIDDYRSGRLLGTSDDGATTGP